MINLLLVDHQKCHEFDISTTKDPSVMAEIYILSSKQPPQKIRFNIGRMLKMGRVVVYRASTPQVWGSINGLGKVDSAFDPRYIGSINEYQACLGSLTLKVSLQTDHQIGTSVHAPQRPMVTCIMMGTVVPGPHGLLCF
ncbi:hypothetical protein TNCV_1684001 [Trichonephila clavipes]|nr:hypothetical protein TNCV_1684001 [Trichonephila clavipes]